MLLDGRPLSDPLLVDASTGTVVTVGDVLDLSARFTLDRRPLTFLIPDRSIESLSTVLALLESGSAVALVDAGAGRDAISALVDRYRPGRIIDPGGTLRCPSQFAGGGPGVAGGEVHPDLAVLLTTSGTTGTAHLVRLSATNVAVNARQIADGLGLVPQDRAITTMPLTYSFGFSVLTSHAISGGCLIVTDASVLESAFWDQVHNHGVTSFAGVPATYAMLKRIGRPDRNTSLRLMLQAGGRLDPDLVLHFHDAMTSVGGRFMVMYGQTEAAPRMTVLPSSSLARRPSSVGLALPQGRVRVLDAEGVPVPVGTTGRVVYEGPNVMMGYADTAADLCDGDTFGHVLDTGDEGYLDDDGYLYLSGRTKRICKLNGVRVSLDEVEALAAALAAGAADVAAVSPREDALTIVVEGTSVASEGLRTGMARRLRVPTRYVGVCRVATIPRLPNGKTDYRAISRDLVK